MTEPLPAVLLYAEERFKRKVLYYSSLTGIFINLLYIPHIPQGLHQICTVLERSVCAGFVAYLVAYLLLSLGETVYQKKKPSRTCLFFSVFLLLIFFVQLSIPPIFIHDEFIGLRYARNSIDFSQMFDTDNSYGQAGFMTQGLMTHLLGGGIMALFISNILFSIGAIAFGAGLLYKWLDKNLLAPGVFIVLAGLNPILLRTSTSEDVHIVGAFYAFLSLYFLEKYFDNQVHLHLYVSMIGAILAACSRQFLIPMPILVALIFYERMGFPNLRHKHIRRGLTFLFIGTVIRWLELIPGYLSSHHHVFYGQGGRWWTTLKMYCILAARFWSEPHPLINQAIFPLPLLVAFVIGLVFIWRSKSVPRTILLAWTYLFALSLGTQFGGIQIRYLFRILFMYLTVLIAVIGWMTAYHYILQHWRKRSTITVFYAVTFIIPLTMVSHTILTESYQDPFTRQVLFIESTAKHLPDEFVLVKFTKEDLQISHLYLDFPDFLLKRHGITAHIYSYGEWVKGLPFKYRHLPVYLFKGVECYTVCVFELEDGWENRSFVAHADKEELKQLFDYQHPGDHRIRQLREPCFCNQDLNLQKSPLTTVIEPKEIATGHLFYMKQPFRIGFTNLAHNRTAAKAAVQIQ